jgi:hypothetical protein
MMQISGKTVTESFNESLKDMAAGANLSSDQISTLYSQLNALDWSNMSDWESLPQTLEELGISIPKDQLQAFIL